jgi:histone H3/H4
MSDAPRELPGKKRAKPNAERIARRVADAIEHCSAAPECVQVLNPGRALINEMIAQRKAKAKAAGRKTVNGA